MCLCPSPRQVVVYDHLLQAGGDAAAGLGGGRAHVLRGLSRGHHDAGRVGQSRVHLPQDPGQRTQLGGGTLGRKRHNQPNQILLWTTSAAALIGFHFRAVLLNLILAYFLGLVIFPYATQSTLLFRQHTE